MKTKIIAVVAGALVTLFSWAIAFVVLNGIYRGNFPWLLTGLVAFLWGSGNLFGSQFV